jgi:hypothetical protein
MIMNERDERAWKAVIDGLAEQGDGNVGVSFDLKAGEPFLRATFQIDGDHYGVPLPASTLREWAGVLTHAADMIEMQFGNIEQADQAMRDMFKEE